MNILVDNDIVLKLSCYRLVDEVLIPMCESPHLLGVLGAVRFVASRRIERLGLEGGHAEAIEELNTLLNRVQTIEPTDEEQSIAADFEIAAQRAGVSLDTGESHLCAIAISRTTQGLLTGDKRAITGLNALLDQDDRLLYLCGKLFCLEQIVAKAINRNPTLIHSAICGQPKVDKTLAICFSFILDLPEI